MKLLFILLIVFSCANFAQVEYTARANQNANTPLFSLDLANYKSNTPNKTKVDFFIQVPYGEIQFVKRGNDFFAGYNVTLTFMDKEKDNILSERTWKEQIVVNDFMQTVSQTSFNLSYRTYDLTPGDYYFKCIVEDLDSRRSSSREFPFTVKNIPDSLAVSDLILITEIRKDSSGESIIPNVSKTVTNKIDSLQYFFEVYSDKERLVHLEYVLDNIKAGTETKTLDPQNIKAGTTTIYHTLKNLNFKLGDYSLKVILKDSDWNEISSIEKKFYSKIYGLPSTVVDLDKASAQLIYIASPEEKDFIEEAENYKEKLERFLAFWDKKKPNPRIEENPILYEYYRRIDFATKNFKGMGEGWRTDMGMIYITFGPPSNVERHPFDSNSRPYEVWDYYELNRSFVFVDQTGFGDYRLYNPDYSRWPGYRP